MKTYLFPQKSEWAALCQRPHIDTAQLQHTVDTILANVRTHGDEAVIQYELRFDQTELSSLTVSEAEMAQAERLVSPELRAAIELAHANIHAFHVAQRFETVQVQTVPGVNCWQSSVPIERVGLYIPGGTAPLFSTVLMLATPAKIAGCREIVLCTPPDRRGRVHPAILVAARVAGVSRIIKAGGVQAIGAMAYGTASVPRVSKIFGPGNQYVTAAKQRVALDGVAIDMPAGPSELCVVADETANADFIAADLISQAEHGPDSQVMFITTSPQMMADVNFMTNRLLNGLPRRDIAEQALEHSSMVLMERDSDMIELANAYAPEHLILQVKDLRLMASQVTNAGSVFLGKYACESAGDYASGTNHTLPTNGCATAYSGVNLDSFCRKITFQHITEEGIRQIGPAVALMAKVERLEGHRNAMTIRMEEIGMKQD